MKKVEEIADIIELQTPADRERIVADSCRVVTRAARQFGGAKLFGRIGRDQRFLHPALGRT